ncbi:pilus assembly protein [Dyella nitratireducens]|uniref:PilY1 beta-propeller domain-containing protein n=1 Tax=Dyella nitratireducens TaxID=1849580 RepID=A0ABQ1GN75_9GAMM|nr:PilC/PilY family type IV pilus protein [Dyella nitratireducens]GGA47020.1 hypothetical protein GCM10010981_40250 [Dyella nitratireducens]GLQ41527.1 hypothetical protein GCM10007902_13770 [Dyella nitratireducens]
MLMPFAQAFAASLPGTVELSPVPLDRSRALPSLATLALNDSVLTDGTLAFLGGYDPVDWSGALKAATLDADGATTGMVWDAGSMLTHPLITPPAGRTILTASRHESGEIAGMAFEPAAPFDEDEKRGLTTQAPENPVDTLEARVDYLRGVRSLELDGSLRQRSSVLGAIVHSQAVYVAYPTGSYANAWPKTAGVAPEAAIGAQSYAQFVAEHAGRLPMLYVAANDGMLHAFYAPAPVCKTQDTQGVCKAYESGRDAGKEQWAYVPRAAYGNLGNLTHARGFQFQPTVDATPVTRDVFFSENGRHEWHTLLAGGLRLGGRGVYALDITDPDTASETAPERTVLWEFDADMPNGASETGATYHPADLGYTYGQPAIARLANGRWAVLVPSGYFADCSKPEKPSRCEEASTPSGYSALFVLDAQTGAVITELKTPSMDGVSSYGLTTPVLGDYDNDQVDDVAFAGDLAGNLWRFDLTALNPEAWKVTLAYRPVQQGEQPITVMPRLFPDPMTNRFMVVFGTGKYLGNDDKMDTAVQSIYGIRDQRDSQGQPVTVQHGSLQPQILSEQTVTDPASGSSASLRSLTSNPVSMQAGGWRIDLDLVAGERVVTTPTALFNTNTVLISTLIPHGDTPEGAIMAIDAATGGSRSIVSFGGGSYAGALVANPPTTGSLPTATRVGGGKLVLPGITLKGSGGDLNLPLSLDSPLWRRRSWSLLTPDS